MKILCTKKEYDELQRRCANTVIMQDCTQCMLCNLCDTMDEVANRPSLTDMCEIVGEEP